MKNTNIFNQSTATAETIANVLNVYRYKKEVKAYFQGARVNTIKFVLNKEYNTVDMYLTIVDNNQDGYSEMPFPLFGKMYDKEITDLATFACFNHVGKDHYNTRDEKIYIYYLV